MITVSYDYGCGLIQFYISRTVHILSELRLNKNYIIYFHLWTWIIITGRHSHIVSPIFCPKLPSTCQWLTNHKTKWQQLKISLIIVSTACHPTTFHMIMQYCCNFFLFPINIHFKNVLDITNRIDKHSIIGIFPFSVLVFLNWKIYFSIKRLKASLRSEASRRTSDVGR